MKERLGGKKEKTTPPPVADAPYKSPKVKKLSARKEKSRKQSVVTKRRPSTKRRNWNWSAVWRKSVLRRRNCRMLPFAKLF